MLDGQNWPIIAALLQFPPVTTLGTPMSEFPAEEWAEVLQEVADAGFAGMELTDSWLPIAELSPSRLDELAAVSKAVGVATPSAWVVRRSVIDCEDGRHNLAYAHRAIDAAARLGCSLVCTWLHQVLTSEQRERLWFWTAPGNLDAADDETRRLAVERFAELGRHAAELGMLLSLELHEDTFLGTGAGAVQLVEDIGLDNVGLNPDIGNLARLHRPVEDWRRLAETTLPYATTGTSRTTCATKTLRGSTMRRFPPHGERVRQLSRRRQDGSRERVQGDRLPRELRRRGVERHGHKPGLPPASDPPARGRVPARAVWGAADPVPVRLFGRSGRALSGPGTTTTPPPSRRRDGRRQNMVQIAQVGSGYMGGGIAQVFALAGFSVGLVDADPELASTNRRRLLEEAARFSAQSLFPADAVDRLEANLSAGDALEDVVASAQLVIEAVPERLDLKHDVLSRISAAAPDAVIGSNTSTISIGELARVVQRPERFLGVHFNNPAPFIPGVELIAHAETAPETVDTVRQMLDAAGKQHALVGDTTGFVVSRLQYALFHEAISIVQEGVATPADVDALVRSTFGRRLPFFGPFAVADMAGLDVYLACYASLQSHFGDRFATPALLQQLVADGKVGTKAGGGFFELDPDAVGDLLDYRNRAFVAVGQLAEDLGPRPA